MIEIWILDAATLIEGNAGVLDRILLKVDLQSIISGRIKVDDDKYEWFSTKTEAVQRAITLIERYQNMKNVEAVNDNSRFDKLLEGLRARIPVADDGNLVNFVTRSGT